MKIEWNAVLISIYRIKSSMPSYTQTQTASVYPMPLYSPTAFSGVVPNHFLIHSLAHAHQNAVLGEKPWGWVSVCTLHSESVSQLREVEMHEWIWNVKHIHNSYLWMWWNLSVCLWFGLCKVCRWAGAENKFYGIYSKKWVDTLHQPQKTFEASSLYSQINPKISLYSTSFGWEKYL